jgi:hypothetical protein
MSPTNTGFITDVAPMGVCYIPGVTKFHALIALALLGDLRVR